MINKMADDIAFHMFAWGRGSKWPMIGPWPCAYACAYVDPVFTGQSYDISTSTNTRRTNLSIFLVLMSTQFSLAYTHVLGCLCLCFCLCASENQALEIGAARRGFACRNRNRIATTIFVFKEKPYPVWFLWPPMPKAIYYGVSIALGYLPLHPSNKRSVSPVFVSQR